jgi:3'-phosphoadenosine 5'-phosphosulfate sulfotransferase
VSNFGSESDVAIVKMVVERRMRELRKNLEDVMAFHRVPREYADRLLNASPEEVKAFIYEIQKRFFVDGPGTLQ